MKAILDRYRIPYQYKTDPASVIPTFKYSLDFILYEDDPHFSDAKKELGKFDLFWQVGTDFDEADLLAAEWFIIYAGEYQYPQPEAAFGYLKKTFDLTAYCDLCGIGNVQNAPFRLKTEPKQRNHQFWGLHWVHDALFVRSGARAILEREKIPGIHFSSPVLHKNGAMIEDFYQLHIDTTLDKAFDPYNTTTITCKVNNEEDWQSDPTLNYCGRIKFHHPERGGYLFDKAVFKPGFEIVRSAEYFGSGASAARLQIVSRRFKELVTKHHLKGLSFTPVMHSRKV